MNEGHDPDRSLVERVQAGDEAAFTSLVERYQKPVLNFVYRWLGRSADAEDVAQDAFVRVYRNIAEFRPGTALFSTWLFQIARNTAIDSLRKRRRRPEEPLGIHEAATGATAAAAAQNHETGERIAVAVAALPEDQRTAVILAEYHGMSYAGIAAVMKCSGKSVESRLYRAKQTLRRALADLM